MAVGQDVKALAEAKCGHRRAAYMSLVTPGDGAALDQNLVTTAAGTVSLPACGFYEIRPSITPTSDVNINRLLRRETGYEGGATLRDFLQLNPSLRGQDVVRAGQKVTLPYRSALRTILLKPTVDAQTAQRELDDRLRRGLGANHAVPSRVGVTGQLVASGPGAQLLAASSCKASAPGRAWPFDAARVVKALGRSMVAAEAAGRIDDNPRARIAILDSGLLQPEAGPFLWRRLVTNVDGQGVRQFGIDAATRLGTPVTPRDVKDADHGTGVATLALGGASFLAADTQGLSKVKLRIARIAHPSAFDTTTPPRVAVVSEEAVAYGLNDAVRNDVQIANASFKFSADIELLHNLLGQNARLLLVVAAGNDIPQERKIDDHPRWPAALGGGAGRFRDRVLTVGASDAADQPTDFTAVSPNYVDLLAPGCAVPTLKLDGSPVNANGTSFAAPLASFGAALLHQLGMASPTAIKERLILGTDVHQRLLPLTWSGGILNLEKAIDIYADQVWIRGQAEPDRRRVYVELTAPVVCALGGAQIPQTWIRRLARLTDDGLWLVMWRSPAGQFDRCVTQLPLDHTIEFETADGLEELALRHVDDIILKEFSAAPR